MNKIDEEKMMYGKKEATMTRGLAIVSMLLLHLFCRKGADVYGTPLLWFNKETPAVYYLGFFSEICVPLYSICAGYAQQLLYDKMKISGRGGQQPNLWKSNIKRIWKLLINYWIILVLFTILGTIFPSDGSMPGSAGKFLKSIFLLHSYNGAWWYLNTYIILMIIPPSVLLFFVKKIKPMFGIACCIAFQFAWYIIQKFGFISGIVFTQPVLAFMWKELQNLIGVLPYFLAGAFVCKGNMISAADEILKEYIDRNRNINRNIILFVGFSILFIVVSVLHQAILMPTVGIIVFFLFNLWKKGKIGERIFLFLGKHSTNIWLTHMFFYLCVFNGFSQRAKYPVFIFITLLAMSVISSYIIMWISNIFIRKR